MYKIEYTNTLFLTPKQSSRQSHWSWSINVSERWEWFLTFEVVGLWTFFHQSLVGLQLFSNCPVHTASDWLGIASTSFGWSDVTQCMCRRPTFSFLLILEVPEFLPNLDRPWYCKSRYCKIRSRSFRQKLQQPFPHNGSLVVSCLCQLPLCFQVCSVSFDLR